MAINLSIKDGKIDLDTEKEKITNLNMMKPYLKDLEKLQSGPNIELFKILIHHQV